LGFRRVVRRPARSEMGVAEDIVSPTPIRHPV